MISLTLLLSIFIWNGRIVVSYRIGNFSQANDNRSGGFPKFPQSFLTNNGNNKLFQSFYTSQKYNNINTDANTCGTRSVQFNPKRSAKIIGGNCSFFYYREIDLVNNCLNFIGSAAPYGAFPWQVEIQIFNYETGIFEHHCGAAVIGERIVMTAAHCTEVCINVNIDDSIIFQNCLVHGLAVR